MKHNIVGTHYADVQRIHGGFADHEYYKDIPPVVSLELRADMFTMANLQKTY